MANSLTGALDDTYLLYANPGAVGFLREWQWSASYTEWIADIFNLSLVYGRHLRINTPWSNRMMFALGVNYQGVRNFDATRGARPSVNAGDLLLNASIGFPLGFVDRNLSFGVNLKYLRSELAQHRASSFVVDVGAIYRSPRFHLSRRGFFQYGIFSAGISLNQMGRSLEFITTKTPLPRTFRSGVALNLGRHDGLQLQLSADYQDVKDEDGRFGFGVQFTNLLSRLIAVRGGFNQIDKRNTDLLSKYSIGFSIKLDDYMNPQAKATAGNPWLGSYRNSDLRADLGFLDGQTVGKVYQGSVTGRTNRPEYFEFASPFFQKFTRLDSVTLAWKATRDPDLYDDVDYMLFISKDDSTGIAQLIEKSEMYVFDPASLRSDSEHDEASEQQFVDYVNLEFYPANLDTSLRLVSVDETMSAATRDESFKLVQHHNPLVAYTIPRGLEHGHYYWTVMAYDKNRHCRFIETDGRKIAEFNVSTPPDLTIHIKKEIKEPERFTIKNVYFEFAKDELNSNSLGELDEWVDFLKTYPDTFTVTGHADIQAASSLDAARRHQVNLEWSKRRALKVFHYLVSQGIDSTRLKLNWLGESAPADTNLSEKAFSRNRRVVLSFPPGFKQPPPEMIANVVFENHFEEARHFSVTLSDADEAQPQLVTRQLTSKVPVFIPSQMDPSKNLFSEQKKEWIQRLQPGQKDSIQLSWDDIKPTLLAEIDVENNVEETADGELNNFDVDQIRYDLKLTNRVNKFIVQSGDTVQYHITVTNLGDDLANNIEVKHVVSEAMSVIFIEEPTLTTKRDTLTWHLSFLRKNESHSFMFEAVIGDLDFDSTAVSITNKSTLFAKNDLDLENNEASTTIYAALIKFEFNKCVLTKESQSVLRDLADIFQNGPSGQRFEIIGFADTTGSSKISRSVRKRYNLELSCLRAKSAKQFLIDSGVTAELVSVGRGESSRYDTYEKNRRVEIKVIPKNVVVEECSCTGSLRFCPCEN